MNNEKYLKAIAIPVYKEGIDKHDEISILQCFSVLGEYPMILICPHSLHVEAYQNIAMKNNINLKIERFSDHYFESLMAYNSFMLEKPFYERLVAYDRVLIYQTDCFVFENKFDYWCKYDYVGAPWIYNFEQTQRFFFLHRQLLKLRKITKKILRKDNHFDVIHYRVGNGGFSIRNPKKSIEIIAKYERNKIIDKYRNPINQYYWEDVFWGCEVNALSPQIKIPSFWKALQFSFENMPEKCYFLNKNRLPFGCHAWERYNLEFWKSHIEKFGYNLDK